MVDTTHDSFQTGGTEWSGVITQAYFNTDTNYQNGEAVLLFLEVEEEGRAEARIEKYSVGAGWDISEEGDKLVPLVKSRRPKKIGNRTKFGRFLGSALDIPELEKVLRSRGEAFDARIWLDLEITVEEEITVATFSDGKRDIRQPLIVEFHGVAGEGSGKASGDGGGTSIPSDDERILAALVALAKDADYADFAVRALAEIPGVEESGDWTSKLLDEAFYIELRG